MNFSVGHKSLNEWIVMVTDLGTDQVLQHVLVPEEPVISRCLREWHFDPTASRALLTLHRVCNVSVGTVVKRVEFAEHTRNLLQQAFLRAIGQFETGCIVNVELCVKHNSTVTLQSLA